MDNSTTVDTQASTGSGQASESQAVATHATEGQPVERHATETQAVEIQVADTPPVATQPVNTSSARRRAAGVTGKSPAVAASIGVLGFALEVAMLAAFLFWGFRQESPWDMVLGIGVPAILVVLWGVFLAPRSERRLKPAMVLWVALALFLLAAGALFAAKAVVLGILMAFFSVGHFVASGYLARQAR